MRHSEELQSILSRFGAGPVSRDQVVQYLTRQPEADAERHAEEVLDDLEDDGYVETVSEEERDLVRFTDRAIDETFG